MAVSDPFATAPVGRTSVRVARLGLGTAPLGGWPEAVAHEQGVAVVQRAWDAGIRYFDSAPYYGYGQAERLLGEVLGDEPREDFVVSTKVGRLLVPSERASAADGPDRARGGSGGLPPTPESDFFKGADPYTPVFDYSYDGTMRSLESSLARLQLDRIDIALIHDPDDYHDEALSGAYRALDALRADGTVGAVGVGMNWSEPLTRFAREADFDCFLLAGRYTLLEQDSLDDLLPAVTERGMSIIAGGVYNSGILADPDASAYFNYAPAPEPIVRRARRLRQVCESFGVPLRAAAAQFPLFHPAVATVAIGSRTPDEVDDNVRLVSWDIPDALWPALVAEGLMRPDAPTPAS